MTQSFRVTQHFTRTTAQSYLTRQSSELYRLQQQISSGLRIQKPSDDPAGIRRSLVQKDRVERLQAHSVSLAHVQSRMEQAHVQLREAGNLLLRARDIALRAAQVTDPTEISVMAAELDGVLQQMASVANSSDESGFLFAGTAAQTKPFPDLNSPAGFSHYDGSSEFTQIHLTGDVQRNALLPGDVVFQPSDRAATVLVGQSGAAAGTGTDTAKGTRELLVTHVATTYAPGSGVAGGTNSAAGDTVIGAAGTHTLQIVDTSGTGAFGTVSLNGGVPVAFTSSDTNLEVIGALGEKVYLNTTAIAASFSGSVSMTATGALSIDGGLTTTPVSFNANQTLTDSRDGSVVFLNTTGVRQIATDHLEFPGTTDVFSAIVGLRDDLLNTRNLSPSERVAALNRRLGDLTRVHNHVMDVVGVQSVSMEQLDRLKTRTEDLTLAEKSRYGETVSADISEAVLRLQEIQNLQQFTMATVARVLTPNLLDFLQ